MSDDSKITYQSSGVDTDKAAAWLSSSLKGHPATQSTFLVNQLGSFAACLDLNVLTEGYDHPYLVTSCDGVGTKLKLALDWDCCEHLGQDLVAMNVNDLLCLGAQPKAFLDYFACGNLKPEAHTKILKNIADVCEQENICLVGGETAEMPGLYQGDDFDLAGFVLGVVDKNKTLGAHLVKEGDVLVGVAGQGAHSNGFSLIRKLVAKEELLSEAQVPWGPVQWKDVLLQPTPLYTETLTPVVKDLKAICHVTGGGIEENLPRVLPEGFQANCHYWELPPLFQWIAESASLDFHEMTSTFHCGWGLILVVAPDKVDHVRSQIKRETQVLGSLSQKESEISSVISWGTP